MKNEFDLLIRQFYKTFMKKRDIYDLIDFEHKIRLYFDD